MLLNPEYGSKAGIDFDTIYPPKPTTSTGVVLSTPVPSPSWPEELSPQHLISRVLVRLQLCSEPSHGMESNDYLLWIRDSGV
jgi:hypothetical protein